MPSCFKGSGFHTLPSQADTHNPFLYQAGIMPRAEVSRMIDPVRKGEIGAPPGAIHPTCGQLLWAFDFPDSVTRSAFPPGSDLSLPAHQRRLCGYKLHRADSFAGLGGRLSGDERGASAPSWNSRISLGIIPQGYRALFALRSRPRLCGGDACCQTSRVLLRWRPHGPRLKRPSASPI